MTVLRFSRDINCEPSRYLDNNNAVFNLCCRLCSAYERTAFLDGLQYGAKLMLELGKEAEQ